MRPTRLIAIPVALALFLGACGGDDDTTAGDGAASADDAATADEAGPGTGDGVGTDASGQPAIAGAIAFDFSTPVAIAPGSGATTPIGEPSEFFQPNRLVADEDAVYAIVSVRDETDQSLATESLVRIDRATGERSFTVELQQMNIGSGEPTDAYRSLHLVGDRVAIEVQPAEGNTVLELFDATDGTRGDRIDLGSVSNPVANGTDVYGRVYGGLVRLDGTTGSWTPVIEEGTALRDVAPDADLVAATVTRDGQPLGPDNEAALEQLLDPIRIDTEHAVVTEDALWWIASDWGISFQDGRQAIHEALVRYDLDSGTVTDWIATGELGAHFLPEEDDFDVATLDGARMIERDGVLYIEDTGVQDDNENGRILRYDPGTGVLEVFYAPTLDGADSHELELLDTDPTGVWATVTRYTVVEENADGSRSSTFETSVVQLDPATGAEITVATL